MTVPNLNEDPEFWEDQSRKKYWSFIAHTNETKRCLFCKWTIEGGLLNKYPGEIKSMTQIIKPEYWFHIASTHGFPSQLFLEMLREEKQYA